MIMHMLSLIGAAIAGIVFLAVIIDLFVFSCYGMIYGQLIKQDVPFRVVDKKGDFVVQQKFYGIWITTYWIPAGCPTRREIEIAFLLDREISKLR